MYEQPFISTSPWNTPIDQADTTYSDPDSIQNQQFRDTSLANTWIQAGTLRFYSSSSDPVATWTYDTLNDHGTFLSNGSLEIQTPSDKTFSVGSDALGMLSDSNGHYYDAWVGSYDASINTYHAAYLVVGDYDTGTGWGDPSTGAGAGVTAAGASLQGGVVTEAELDSGQINHALAIELDHSQLAAGTDQSDQFVFPAVSADSDSTTSYTGTIPMGAHFALPADLDLSCAGLTPEGYAVAKAYQDYGGYVVDSGGHTTSLGAIDSSVTETQVTNLFQDIQWIRDHLVIISGNIDMTNGNVINNDNTETGDPGTVVPIPSAVVPTIVAFSNDSGIIGDHITNDSTLTLTGTAEANSTVKVSDGTTPHITAAANGTGAWSYASGKLSDNTHSFTATDTDAAGNVSAASSALAVTAAPSHLPVVTASDFTASHNHGHDWSAWQEFHALI